MDHCDYCKKNLAYSKNTFDNTKMCFNCNMQLFANGRMAKSKCMCQRCGNLEICALIDWQHATFCPPCLYEFENDYIYFA